MNKHVIRMELTPDSIGSAIKELEAYRDGLNAKCDEFINQLAEVGISEIDSHMPQGKTYDEKLIESGSDPAHSTEITITGPVGERTGELTVQGPELMFIEFGAGVHYNGTGAKSFGTYEIGSYGKGHGRYNRPWGYYDSEGNLILSYGTAAAEPVYKAYQLMKKKQKSIAKQVFST